MLTRSNLAGCALTVAVVCPLFGPALVSRGQSNGTATNAAPQTADWPAFQKTVQPFLAKHCFECHGDKESGEVRLDRFQDGVALAKGWETIEKAMEALRKHAMPPKKKAQPTGDELKPVLTWMETFVARMESRDPVNPGRVVIRRLNRTEYNNTVRDLLGVIIRPADDFPSDNSGYGFDNIGAALSMSPALTEKYVTAAENVARTAVFGVERLKPVRITHEPFIVNYSSWKATVKHVYDETGMSLPGALHHVHRFPADGEYVIRGVMRGYRPSASNPMEMGLWIDGKLIHEAKLAIPESAEMSGQATEVRVPVTAGDHWLSVTMLRVFDGLPPVYKGPNPANTTAGFGKEDRDTFISIVAVSGPYAQVLGPSQESLKKIFTCGHVNGQHDAACARKIVGDLARRAYRRPVTDKEVDELVKLVAMVQKDGDSFEEGLVLAIQKMLISPHFLFRVEKAPSPPTPVTGRERGEEKRGPDVRPISDHELASRLSYFLWSSMPDDELLRCADEQSLRKPVVLEAQVRRMLKDAKAQALVENFGGQWLQTRALEAHVPNRVTFQQFTDYTRVSMKRETDLFFDHIIKEDRSILDFIDANYTFLNQRLAEFYKIPGVKGHEFRRVDLTGTPRGGVWTQGAVLTVSSYAHRTSPVLRGKWLLDNLLNAPPPPPPPDVPNLDEMGVGKSVSVREQLEKHRGNATCASCHARMDALGFGLENFDAIGSWRDKDGKIDIDSSGTLPDGRSFQGPQQLREILKSDPNAFAECLTEKMLTYALGRGLERYDRKAVRTIAEQTAKDNYRFSSLVLAIVQSMPFQMQQVNRGTP